MQLVSESARKLWNKCELRVMVLLSLTLQTVLILIGNRRKSSTAIWLRIVLWLAYMSADWVATVCLGVLSNNSGNTIDPTQVITSLWAPFLLLHLGGPDTITAYALEDNELWLRHLLGLIVQVGVAFYVFLQAWYTKVLNFLAIPMFIAGIIKFGERIWVLRSASTEQFRESMLPRPDPGPNYARYMEEYCSKKAEGFKVQSRIVNIEAPNEGGNSNKGETNDIIKDAAILQKASAFFKTFKCLYGDLILSFHDVKNSREFFQDKNRSFEEAFKVIEVELGFIYDEFYTKAVILRHRLGRILRCISFSSTVCVFVAFFITEKRVYKDIDVIITYILLVGAILLELYAVIVLISSDWARLWLSSHKYVVMNLLYKAISCTPLVRKKRWSNTMSQYNLIRFCLKEKPTNRGLNLIQRVLFFHEDLEKFWYKKTEKVPKELKQLIFKQLLEKSKKATNSAACKQICAYRGDGVLKKEEFAGCFEKLASSIEVEFDHSILLWHIATDLIYHSDPEINSNNIHVDSAEFRAKLLSDYMLYLLVMCPFMLPNGIGQIRFRDTCAETIEFREERKSITNEVNACSMLLRVSTEIKPGDVKGDRSKSVLFDACRLAKSLKDLETEKKWDKGKKWELMSNVWVEMLCYAASRCRWNHHAQQLRRGGELLTHVWLLMAHLGITEQFQISQGHARAKLIVQ